MRPKRGWNGELGGLSKVYYVRVMGRRTQFILFKNKCSVRISHMENNIN